MGKVIADLHELYGVLAGKNVASKPSPEKFDAVVYEIVISVFNQNIELYEKTQQISDYLKNFKKKKAVTITSGFGELPSDYAHPRYISTAQGKKVDIVGDKFWSGRVNSKLAAPTTDNPICKVEHNGEEGAQSKVGIIVSPTNTQSLMLYYFKKPTKPRWAYTITGDRYVYDEANTVDVDFDILLFPNLVMGILSRFGINLREQQVIQYAEQARAMETKR
jgi:signal-transduction protein with cAMP-binding, CBS, and nucleotidyltransferase domain